MRPLSLLPVSCQLDVVERFVNLSTLKRFSTVTRICDRYVTLIASTGFLDKLRLNVVVSVDVCIWTLYAHVSDRTNVSQLSWCALILWRSRLVMVSYKARSAQSSDDDWRLSSLLLYPMWRIRQWRTLQQIEVAFCQQTFQDAIRQYPILCKTSCHVCCCHHFRQNRSCQYDTTVYHWDNKFVAGFHFGARTQNVKGNKF